MNRKIKYLIGVDEAGRGPLAGPVAVAAVVISPKLSMSRATLDMKRGVLGLRDSKKLNVKQREVWYGWLREKRGQRKLNFAVALVGHKIIDREGITRAVRIGIARCLRRLELNPAVCEVKLDGSLRASRAYVNQVTIIHGDSFVPVIMLASIAAKVTRDRRMSRLAGVYPKYGFEIHKGYGTKRHYQQIKRHGLSPIHRRSFNLQIPVKYARK